MHLAYVDLVRGEGAMELPIGSVDHFNHISLANTLHGLEIELGICFFSIFGQAGTRATAIFGGHDDCCSGYEKRVMV